MTGAASDGTGARRATVGARCRSLVAAVAALPVTLGRPATTRAPSVPQLDGLRFVAIMLVLVWHVTLRASRFADRLTESGITVANPYGWFPHGEVGVALFFVVSGFVIAQPFLRTPRRDWCFGDFYLRRVRRIYPPYVIALTSCLILATAMDFQRTSSQLSYAQSWAASLVYLHSWLFDEPSRLDPPIWSLEIEIQFYALTPLLLLLYTLPARLRDRCALGLGMMALALVTSSLIDLAAPFDGRFRFGLLVHMHLFVAGIVAADVERSHSIVQAPPSRAADVLLAAGSVALVVIGLLLARVDARPGGGWPDLLSNGGTLVAIVAIVIGSLRGRIGRAVLSQPWIALIGTMCFSIYLVHVVVIEALSAAFMQRLPLQDGATITAVHVLVLVPASLVAGALFYVAVERPFMMAAPIHTLPILGRWTTRVSAAPVAKARPNPDPGRG